ncbi:MAG TPA: TetR/AcrR family transcriptional regulator, partial [Saprospiraceae bacterium]|nr:TetR/AcrR family transcriptional regulator [Saprospiraceae bacterium]
MDIKTQIKQKAITFFLKYGIKNVTMDHLSTELGMSKKTLYKYFSNKNELLLEALEVYEHRDNDLTCEIVGENLDPVETIFLVFRQIITSLQEISPVTIYELKKYYAHIWDKFHKNKEQMVFDQMTKNILRGKEMGLYREEINVEIICQLYFNTVLLMTDEAVFPGSKFDKKLLLQEYIIYHLNGIANDKGRKLIQKYQVKY